MTGSESRKSGRSCSDRICRNKFPNESMVKMNRHTPHPALSPLRGEGKKRITLSNVSVAANTPGIGERGKVRYEA
jgi:hypothetical protein